MTSTTTGIVRLAERQPAVSGAEMVAALVPPPQFDDATFETYRADPAYPSQQEAKDRLIAFSRGSGPAERGGLFRRAKKAPEMKPGVYLDGGFGVGKTHLLAAIYHAVPARRKYFGSFIEYTALVGAIGYQKTVELFRGADLLCIDEFELDDPGDTMVMTRLLGELVPTGTRLAATSNTPPSTRWPRASRRFASTAPTTASVPSTATPRCGTTTAIAPRSTRPPHPAWSPTTVSAT